MIKVLGADGSYSDKHKATSFLIDKNIVIDAGNIIESMGDECCRLEHIFITHTHFDHIIDLPFIIESYFEHREKPLKIYALKENIQILQKYLFNWSIWPDFVQIVHNGDKDESALQLIPIEYEESIYINDIEITPIFANHSTPACGFKIKRNDHSFLFSGDTYVNDKLIERINMDMSISSLLIDVSFSSDAEKLASTSKHLTPKLLQKMLGSLKRDDIAVYTYHQKPSYIEKIDNELSDMNLLKNGGKRLETGDVLDLFSPVSSRKRVKSLEFHYDNENYFKDLFQLLQKIQTETDHTKQLNIVVEQTMKLTHADSAALYLVDNEKNELECNIYFNNTLNIHNSNLNEIELNSCFEEMKPDKEFLSKLHSCKKEDLIIKNIYEDNYFDFNWLKQFDKSTGCCSASTVMVSMTDHKNEIIGILQLINKKNIHGEDIPFNDFDYDVAQTLVYQALSSIKH